MPLDAALTMTLWFTLTPVSDPLAHFRAGYLASLVDRVMSPVPGLAFPSPLSNWHRVAKATWSAQSGPPAATRNEPTDE